MTTGDRTYDANASVIETQVKALQASAGGFTIYREGGVASGNVYATLLAAVDACPLGGRVYVDGSLGNPTTQAVTYDVDAKPIVGLGAFPPILTVVDGTTFTAATYFEMVFEGITVQWVGGHAAIVVGFGLGLELRDYAVVTSTNASSSAFILNKTGDLYVTVGYACGINGSSGHQIIDLGLISDSSACEVNVKATLPSTDEFFVAALSANSVTGGPSGALTVTDTSAGLTVGGGLATISHTQTGTTAPTFRP